LGCDRADDDEKPAVFTSRDCGLLDTGCGVGAGGTGEKHGAADPGRDKDKLAAPLDE
jgi:hypothetical protein